MLEQRAEVIREKLKGFSKHGIEIKRIVGNQAQSDCPFSGKEDKFYINVDNLLWDSKTANLSGNFPKFLKLIHKKYRKDMVQEHYRILSKERGLPISILKDYRVGIKDGGTYVIPVSNQYSKIVDLRMYRVGKKTMSTPTCQVGLLGAEKLARAKKDVPVFICEGEWDAMALDWVFKKVRKRAVVVGVPGAMIFKSEWIPLFRDRDVFVVYDNDDAGEMGEHIVLEKLTGVAKKFKFIHWLEDFSVGFDIRDFVKLEGIKRERPERCVEKILMMMKEFPRRKFTGAPEQQKLRNSTKPLPPVDRKMNWDKLSKIIEKWMKIDDLSPYLVAMATVISNHIEGDPVWLFIVASPGEGKSELLGSLKFCEEVYTTSSITPNALISGSVNTRNGHEPSLLPKINGMTLCIKDISAIQSMRDTDRESLFGILRDAYDGSAGKVFGTGETKYFESRFSMLAGVTPSIYQLDQQFSSLGERFLKLFMGSYLHHKNQIDVIMRAMGNVGRETRMREEIATAIRSYIENIKIYMKREDYKPPKLSPETEEKIAFLAAWCSRMRGVVARDKYEKDVMLSKSYAEVGTRTGKQLKRTMLCMPTIIYRGRETSWEYDVIKKIALDTVSAKKEDLFRAVYLRTLKSTEAVEFKTIVKDTKYSFATVMRGIEDLVSLDVIERLGIRRPFRYTISKKMKMFTRKAGLYESALETARPYRSVLEQNTPSKQV